MNKKKVILINISILLVNYLLRAGIKNWVFVLDFIVFLELIFVLILLLRMVLRIFRSRQNIKRTILHISLIASVIWFGGDIVSIQYLKIRHYRTIKIFEKYESIVPVHDRFCGDWILEEEEFTSQISEKEAKILARNFRKWSPCFFHDGYCYMKFGGYLRNLGGYYFDIHNRKEKPRSFEFTHVNYHWKYLSDWGKYAK